MLLLVAAGAAASARVRVFRAAIGVARVVDNDGADSRVGVSQPSRAAISWSRECWDVLGLCDQQVGEGRSLLALWKARKMHTHTTHTTRSLPPHLTPSPRYWAGVCMLTMLVLFVCGMSIGDERFGGSQWKACLIRLG